MTPVVALMSRELAREVLILNRRIIPARAQCEWIAISVALDDGSPAIVGTARIAKVIDLARSDIPLEQERWISLAHQHWWLLTNVTLFERALEGLPDGSTVEHGLLARLRAAHELEAERGAGL